MPLNLISDILPSTEFSQISRRSRLHAVLIGVAAALFFWFSDSLFDAFIFHENTLKELFSPDHRELSMRLIIVFGVALFSYFYLRLRQTGQQLSVFFAMAENAADCVLMRTLDGRILYANKMASQKLGYSRAELVTMNLKDIDPTVHDAELKSSFEILRQNKISGGEREHRTKSGHHIPVEFLGSYLKIGGREYAFSVIRDISERKRLEQKLKSNQASLIEAQRIAHLGSYVWDMKTDAAEFSDEIYHLYGRNVGDPDFTLKKSLDLVHPEDRVRLRNTIEEDIRNKRPHTSEYRIMWADGTEHWVHCQGEFVLDHAGNPLRLLGTIRDISESKQAALELERHASELAESNRLKDIFTDVLRHDILNPASAVQLSTALLVRGETNPRKIKHLQNIQKSISSLVEMTESAAKLAKVATTKDMEFSPLDLNHILRDVLIDFEPQLKKSNTVIEFGTVGEAPADVNPLIRDVFSNLISNAIKYGRQEKGKVEINIGDNDYSWIVSVTDNGAGISDENKERIFNRFERIDKQGVKGSGLGLTIVAQIISMHGGRIWVEDNPKGGSIFRVRLPKKQMGTDKMNASKPNQYQVIESTHIPALSATERSSAFPRVAG